MVQPYSAVVAIAMISTSSSTSGMKVTPSEISTRNAIIAMKPPVMKTSPWAKLIMPMMP